MSNGARPHHFREKHARAASGLEQLPSPPFPKQLQLLCGHMDQLATHTAGTPAADNPSWGKAPSCGQLGAWLSIQGGRAHPCRHRKIREPWRGCSRLTSKEQPGRLPLNLQEPCSQPTSRPGLLGAH